VGVPTDDDDNDDDDDNIKTGVGLLLKVTCSHVHRKSGNISQIVKTNVVATDH